MPLVVRRTSPLSSVMMPLTVRRRRRALRIPLVVYRSSAAAALFNDGAGLFGCRSPFAALRTTSRSLDVTRHSSLAAALFDDSVTLFGCRSPLALRQSP